MRSNFSSVFQNTYFIVTEIIFIQSTPTYLFPEFLQIFKFKGCKVKSRGGFSNSEAKKNNTSLNTIFNIMVLRDVFHGNPLDKVY